LEIMSGMARSNSRRTLKGAGNGESRLFPFRSSGPQSMAAFVRPPVDSGDESYVRKTEPLDFLLGWNKSTGFMAGASKTVNWVPAIRVW